MNALLEMECHLAVIDVALLGDASFPGYFSTPIPNVALPRSLAARARLLLERQRDAEAALRARTEVLGGYIFAPSVDSDPTGVSINVRS